jgi:predicted RNA-binding protein YlxR (DUF448 family)
VRMCMACGGRTPQAELFRISRARDGTLSIADPSRPGRSGYLHRREECWERFAARKGLVRSLGCSVDKAARMAFVQELKRSLRNAIVE